MGLAIFAVFCQMGIGGIPDAVLSALKNHKDLGVHTEMFTDGVVPLVENGAINNSKKKIYKGLPKYDEVRYKVCDGA